MSAARTLVLGGGISGLSLGFLLKSRGEDVRVLEATAAPGGNIITHSEQGFLLEDGPNAFLDREPSFRALLSSLQLTSSVREASASARGRYIARGGRLRKVSPLALVKPGLLSVRGKLRLLAEPFSRRGPALDETVAQFFSRHLGEEATRTVVDAVQTGIYAGDIDALSVRSTFPSVVGLEAEHRSLLLGLLNSKVQGSKRLGPDPAAQETSRPRLCTFEGGMSTLTQALTRALGDALTLNAKAMRIERTAQGFTVRLQDGAALEAHRVVLALPAHAAAPVVAPLHEQLASALGAIPYAPMAVVHLGYTSPGPGARARGFGFLAPDVEGLDVLGVIYASNVFPFRAPAGATLFTCLVGGARHPERVPWTDEALVLAARASLRKMLAVDDAPDLARVVRWQHGIPQYNVGHGARWDGIQARLAETPGLFVTGNAYQGVGVLDCVRMSWQLAERLSSKR